MDSWSIVLVFLLSLLPSFEGRYAILASLVLGLDLLSAFLIASAAIIALSIVLGYLIYYIDDIMGWFGRSRIGLLRRVKGFYDKYVLGVRRRAKPYVDRYGVPGLIVFVAIPLPATGVWTGALAGYVLGMERRKLIPCLVAGGLVSNVIILLSVLAAHRVAG